MPLDTDFWKEFIPPYTDIKELLEMKEARKDKTRGMDLGKYVTCLRECTNECEYLTELNLYDNYEIMLFGDNELFLKILSAFENSGTPGSIEDYWQRREWDAFRYQTNSTTPFAQVLNPQLWPDYTTTAKACIRLHPVEGREKLMDTNWHNMAYAVAGVLDYIMAERVPCFLEEPCILYFPNS